MKTVPGPKAEQGKEALLRGNESEGPHVCVLGAGRDEDCFQFPAITRMVPLASNGGLQLGTRTQVCIPIVLEFRIPFPYYLKQAGAASVSFLSSRLHKKAISNIL